MTEVVFDYSKAVRANVNGKHYKLGSVKVKPGFIRAEIANPSSITVGSEIAFAGEGHREFATVLQVNENSVIAIASPRWAQLKQSEKDTVDDLFTTKNFKGLEKLVADQTISQVMRDYAERSLDDLDYAMQSYKRDVRS